MKKVANQSSDTTAALVDIPMPVESVAAAIKAGYKKSDISYQLIGNRRLPCVMVKGTEQERINYIRLLDNERKAEDRERRCLIPDGKGGYIMCPECNKCRECTKYHSLNFESNRPISLEKFIEGDGDDDRAFDVASATDVEGDAMVFATLDILIEHLTKLNKEYGHIFEMLFDQWGVKEIAEELNIPWSTAKDRIKKVQKLAQEYYGEKE